MISVQSLPHEFETTKKFSKLFFFQFELTYLQTKHVEMKQLLVLIFVVPSFLLVTCDVKGNGILNYKLVKCYGNPKFIYPNYSCTVKSYSRNVSTISVYVLLKKPISEAFVSLPFMSLKYF